MAFKKQYSKEDFLSALSHEWKKTREIADKVGCKNQHATRTLQNLYDVVVVGTLKRYPVYNAVEIVEYRWVPGGKTGTREWRLKDDMKIVELMERFDMAGI